MTKKIIKGNLIEKYKSLPEARQIPDILWTAQNQINRMDKIKIELRNLQEDYTWNIFPKLIYILKQDWTDEELKKAGFLGKEG